MTAPAPWINWFGNVASVPAQMCRPASDDELAAAVTTAVDRGLPIRAVGAGHSNVPIVACDGGLIVELSRLSGLRTVDVTRKTATFGAGTTIADIGPILWEHGLSFYNQGDINSQHLGGAISTATHGTGITLGSFSDRLTAARLLAVDGTIHEISAADPDLLRAARTAVGTLGIFTELTIAVTDAFSLELNVEVTQWEDLIERWADLVTNHRHFTYYWCPTGTNPWAPISGAGLDGTENVIIKTMDSRPADHPRTGTKWQTRFVAPAYQVWPDPYAADFHEMEYMVPLASGIAAVADIRDLILTRFPDERFPVEVRFAGADDAMLSPMNSRESCVISVSGRMGPDNSTFFRACDSVLRAYDGRPHWGKWHEFDSADLAATYPEYSAFQRIRRQLDPNDALLTPHMRRIFG
jgi:FAD/FMN-containing dehydrogenase